MQRLVKAFALEPAVYNTHTAASTRDDIVSDIVSLLHSKKFKLQRILFNFSK